MIPELTQREFSQTLDEIAAELMTVLDEAGPPVDALALARGLGMDVAWDARQAHCGRLVRLRGYAQPASHGSILLRPEERPERLQWAIAHEIDETSAVRVFERLNVDPREAPAGSREAVANQLASRVLLPRRWFLEAAASGGWDLIALKKRFSTASHELIARRMLDFAPPVIVTICDHGRPTFRRSNLGRRIPRLVPLESAVWREAHENARPASESDAYCRVQAWPVHEAHWKREILRTLWYADEELEILV
jgi:hypothetical protein